MKTRLWLNIALIAIIAILVAVVYFRPGAKKPALPVPLTSLKATDIHDIKIAQPGAASVELARHGDTWQMTAPVKIPADQYLVQSLLDDIHAAVKSGFAAKQVDLGKYGLDPPHIRLWLNDTEFDFGDTEPLNNYRYILSGGRVLLTSGLLFYRINHRPYWWTSKRLLPEGARITAIQLPDATLTLKGTKWQLSPANPTVSSDAIQSLVDNWQNAQAIGTDKLGAGTSQGEVAIALANEKPALRFVILKDPDFLVLARPDLGVQYDLDSSQRDALLAFKSASPPPRAATITKPAGSTSKELSPLRGRGSG
ncbi:MAG: DUF4340 domain-containing protein [Gammaproteobacteria bacterium]